MTSEEAIRTLEDYRNLFQYGSGCNAYTVEELLGALNMAIKALKQEPCEDCVSRHEVMCAIGSTSLHYELARKLRKLPSVTPKQTDVLDKIRAEIMLKDGLEEALEIIDKYKSESEDKE